MEPVAEIDVGRSPLAVERFEPTGAAASVGVTGFVARAFIRLYLGDHRGALEVRIAPDDELADEVARDLEGRAIEVGAIEPAWRA